MGEVEDEALGEDPDVALDEDPDVALDKALVYLLAFCRSHV